MSDTPYNRQLAERIQTVNQKLLYLVDEIANITNDTIHLTISPEDLAAHLSVASQTLSALNSELSEIADSVVIS